MRYVNFRMAQFCNLIFKDPLSITNFMDLSCVLPKFFMIASGDGIMSDISKLNVWKLLHSTGYIGQVSMPRFKSMVSPLRSQPSQHWR